MQTLLPAVYTLIIITIGGFIASRISKRNDIADISWGLGPLLIAISSISVIDELTIKTKLVIFLVFLWSIRLAFYMWYRSKGQPEDPRYIKLRKEWGEKEPINAFVKVFVLQSSLMLLTTISIVSVVTSNVQEIFIVDFIALCLFVIGFIFETRADIEMYQFKKQPRESRPKVFKEGLWKYSRHPNYFGEILVWWGFFLFAATSGFGMINIISPILITFLLAKVSGVKMTEDVLIENKGDEYRDYINNTNAIIPIKINQVVKFLSIVIVTFFIDYLWLGNLMQAFYIDHAQDFARVVDGKFDAIIWAALGVYFFIPLAIYYFAINTDIVKSRAHAFFNGVLVGLTMYTVYDFTNISLLKQWPLEMAIIDILWGCLLCGITSTITYRRA